MPLLSSPGSSVGQSDGFLQEVGLLVETSAVEAVKFRETFTDRKGNPEPSPDSEGCLGRCRDLTAAI